MLPELKYFIRKKVSKIVQTGQLTRKCVIAKRYITKKAYGRVNEGADRDSIPYYAIQFFHTLITYAGENLKNLPTFQITYIC